MKKTIRIISLTLSLFLVVALIPAFAAAQGTAEPGTLPKAGNSAFATGAAFRTVRMEFASEYQVTDQNTTDVALKTATEIPIGMAGFLVKIEAEGAFNFSFSPKTATRPDGHGFKGAAGYSVFEWDAGQSAWKEHPGTAWNVANLTGGTYFIPKDAYSAASELAAGNSITAFFSVGRGATMTVRALSLVTVTEPEPTVCPDGTTPVYTLPLLTPDELSAVPAGVNGKPLEGGYRLLKHGAAVTVSKNSTVPPDATGLLIRLDGYCNSVSVSLNGTSLNNAGIPTPVYTYSNGSWTEASRTAWYVPVGCENGTYLYIPFTSYFTGYNGTQMTEAGFHAMAVTSVTMIPAGGAATVCSVGYVIAEQTLADQAVPATLPGSAVENNGLAKNLQGATFTTQTILSNAVLRASTASDFPLNNFGCRIDTRYGEKSFDLNGVTIPKDAVGFLVKYVKFDGSNDYAVRPTVNGKQYTTNGKNLTHYQYDGEKWTANTMNHWGVTANVSSGYGYTFLPLENFADPMNGLIGSEISKMTVVSGGRVTVAEISFVLAEDIGLVSAQPALGKNIDLTFEAILPANATAAELEITMNGKTGTAVRLTETVSAYGTVEFLLKDILPQEMADEMTVVLKVNGTAFETMTYSIRQYAQRMLTAYPEDAGLKALLSAMLRYGASVQAWQNYHTDNLATDGVSGMTEAPEAVTPNDITVTVPTVTGSVWKTVTLRLESDIAVKVRLESTEQVTVTVNGRSSVLTPENGVVVFEGLAVNEMNDTVTFRVGENTFTVSANAVLKQVLSGTAGDAEKAAAGALYCYGVAAEAYAGNYRNDFSPVNQSVEDAELPEFSSSAGTLLGGCVYYQGNGNYVVGYKNVTEAEVKTYLTQLVALGYEKKAGNQLGSVTTATYQRASATVYSNWNAAEKCFRLTVGNDSYLPPASSGSHTAVKAPTLTQLARSGAKQTAPGMSYVLQLADGRYILVDGGGSDADDEATLLQYLTENKPDTHEKPVIALWMATHAHGDHIGLATDFLEHHGKEVTLEAIAHNFPDFQYNQASKEDLIAGMSAFANRFLVVARAASPTLNCWILHTGQTAEIAGAKIEILYTPEDYFPNAIDWGNDTSCAWKITVAGKTILFSGDCDPILCDDMAKWYGADVLQCDVLQVCHHGFNGATMAFYQAIDPKICLWPCDETRFLEDERCLGTLSKYAFNQFLREEKWARGNVTGEREHYHAGQTYIYRFT